MGRCVKTHAAELFPHESLYLGSCTTATRLLNNVGSQTHTANTQRTHNPTLQHSPWLLTCIQWTCSLGGCHFQSVAQRWEWGELRLPWHSPASCCATRVSAGPPESRLVRCTGRREPPRPRPEPQHNWKFQNRNLNLTSFRTREDVIKAEKY